MTKVAATTTSNSSVSSGLTSLLKLLPTGTVFIFQFLSPVLSNNGKCHTLNKIFMSVLIGVSGLACALGSFTDSFTDGKTTYYGIATLKGLWTSGSKEKSNDPDYALQAGDFVHAGLSLLVFAAVAVLDSNTVDCFFPSLKSSENTLMAVLPVIIGAIASLVFYFFPSKREGIGYASTTTSTTTTSSKSTKSSSDASKETSNV